MANDNKRNFLDLEELRMEIFGGRVSKAHIYNCVKRGEIKTIRLGNRLLVPSWFVEQLISEKPDTLPAMMQIK